ncbi:MULTISPECIES: hypothetical protein [unclassified Agarivorans]|uniref:hypothetical protein n=1 Tax=unclassified Agarivorans TaxID=2636026 RepID=UPI0026E48290|nr:MULTISPECIES: hypothetical protein [unclassified Agarivorans]MDO6684024.1 hypothetical protein [Agarivorans sp. 3_MG-2023]MDO6714242.1 hypothetical protein [Agarivorans sp. 2_MG-2023]
MREAHGSIEFALNGQIMEIEGTGPWNLEQMEESGSAAAPILDKLLDSPWAVLATFHGETFYTEDAANQLIEWLKIEKQRGRVATALILTHASVPELAKWHLSQIYIQAGETVQIFIDKTDALAWLSSKITDYELQAQTLTEKHL